VKVTDQNTWAEYNALDSTVLYTINEKTQSEIIGSPYEDAYRQTMAMYPILQYWSIKGLRVDKSNIDILNRETQAKVKIAQEKLNEICGFELNPSSPKQCQQYFYGILGHTPYTASSTGNITTDDTAMVRLARKGIKEAKLVQEIRGLNKLSSTYLQVALDEDGRLRCSWNPRVSTGRLSSRKTIYGTGMNLQNIHPEFKKFIVPDEGHMFMEFDKRQAEWVIVAYVSGDATMIAVVESGKDPHLATGGLISGLTPELVKLESKVVGMNTDPTTIEELRRQIPEVEEVAIFLPRNMSVRQAGKKGNHGLNYDEGYRTFALKNEIPEKESSIIVDRYHHAYVGVRNNYHEYIKTQLGKDRTITNLFGVPRRFSGRWGDALFKDAYAQIPQSTVAYLINRGLIRIWNNKLNDSFMEKLDPLSQTHDSILTQFEIDDWTDMARTAIRINHYLSPVLSWCGRGFNIATDLKVGMSWGNLTEVPLVDNVTELADRLEEVYHGM